MLTTVRLLVVLAGSMLVLAASILPSFADSDIAGRLEREAQQASNSGRYEEARQLRAIAGATRSQDSVTSRQIQSEVGQRNYDKAKEILRIR
jgi:hypothetical protein